MPIRAGRSGAGRFGGRVPGPAGCLTGAAQARLNTRGEREVRRFAALAGSIAATALAVVGAPPATASRGLGMSLRVSGSLVATWHGDPARGCAAAGVCDVSGSATYRPGFEGRLDVSRDSVGFGGADSAQAPVVRVRDGTPGARIPCADVLEAGFSPLGFEYLGDELQVTLEDLELSAGRCAGPRTLDLAHALPHGSVKTRLLRRAPRVLDLSARSRFAAGPFTGEVVSTVRLALGRAHTVRDRFLPGIVRVPSGRGGRTRYSVLDLRYRIAEVAGALVTDFHGLPDPACGALGACGTTGSSSYTLKGVSGRVDVTGVRRLRRGQRRPSVGAELRALRKGSLPVYADSRLWKARATVSERVTSPGVSCSDSLFTEPPIVESRSTRKELILLVRSGDLGDLGDTLRTRCPGPSQSDVLRRGSLAHGGIAVGAVGGKALQVPLASARAFSRNGYAGSRHGQLDLRLELVRTQVYVVKG
jgi:hypothetical protein